MCFESSFERKTGTIPTVFGWDLVEEEEYYVLIDSFSISQNYDFQIFSFFNSLIQSL